MNWSPAERIADAVLHEGYLLYPYRPSALKNRRRWTFGVLCPPAFCSREAAGDRSSTRTECLVEGGGELSIAAKVRFLQQLEQSVEERAVELDDVPVRRLIERAEKRALCFPPLELAIQLDAVEVASGLTRVRLHVENLTSFPEGARDEAMGHSLLSCHALLGARSGRFVSLADPPPAWAAHAEACENLGIWPVLVGDPQARSLVLSSPIILPDFPSVAPESPGDFFDGTEIDELLSLRILTLGDSEKEAMREADARARRLLDRTEGLSPDALLALHGTWRRDASSAPFEPGQRVRLQPTGRADIFDLELRGKEATIVSLEVDMEGLTYLTVTVDDDPGRDLGRLGQPGHRFFFRADEVEPL